jgi:hypothetical protein
MVNGENSRSGSEFGSGSISQRHGSVDPDPHQNVMEPQHWFLSCTVLIPIREKKITNFRLNYLLRLNFFVIFALSLL